jgi:hypothetical protein
MAAAIRPMIPLALCVTILAIFAGPALAQEGNPLPEVRERLKIEAQRIEKEVQDGRKKAYRLLRNDPEEALNVLKDLIGALRKDTSLSEERRTSLLAVVQRDLGNVRALVNVRWTTTQAGGGAGTPPPTERGRYAARPRSRSARC